VSEGEGEGDSAGRGSGGAASEHLELLRRVTEGMTLHRKLEDVLGAITRGLVGAADAALARIWLYTAAGACGVCARDARADPAARDARSLHLCASAGIFEDLAGPLHRVPLGTYLGGRVAEHRAPLLLDDLQAEPSARDLPWIAEHGLRGFAGYPLLFDGQLEGVLGVFRRRPWEPEAFRVLGIFAAQAAIAIKNAALVEAVERRSERLTLENAYLQDELRRDHGSGAIVGRSAALREVLGRLERVAPTGST
jgi:formate hydrogenlyase transcriptional activator